MNANRMKRILYLYPDYDPAITNPQQFREANHTRIHALQQMAIPVDTEIELVSRAGFDGKDLSGGIQYHFINDYLAPRLRWWEEPEKLFQATALLRPNLVHIIGLEGPLDPRRLRRYLNPECIIVAEHHGEEQWIQRHLWLQQFGLRAADAFVFGDESAISHWKKSALVLERQPVLLLNPVQPDDHAGLLKEFYSNWI
jgi:hypothetical protein